MGNNGVVSDLIDTTEMYLRTIYELVEEGITPLRARIAERLHQSGPTVSQTVARMERDGLVTVEGDRHLQLTEEGNSLATRVMRKHRLAERLLTDVIGLDWELVHEEACRWEHVMSETVERRLLELLDHPTESPYGNPIPGLSELGESELRRGVPRRRRGAERRRRHGVTTGAGAADQRGDAEGRDADGCPASRRRDPRCGDRRRRHRRRASCSAAPARRPRSCPRPPSTSSSRRPEGHRLGCRRSAHASDQRVSHSLQPSSILTVARSSPRVTPRLTMTTGRPALAAYRTKRRPDITVSDEPETSSESARSSAA